MFLSTSGMSSCPALPPKCSTLRNPTSTASYETAARTPSSPGNGTTAPCFRSARYALILPSTSELRGCAASIGGEASAVIDQPFHESVERHEPVVREAAGDLDHFAERHQALHTPRREQVAQRVGARLRVDPDRLRRDVHVLERVVQRRDPHD